MFSIVALWCVVSGLGAVPVQAQRGGIAGVIVASETGEPLAHGIVSITQLGREQFTDDSGRFVLRDIPAGPRQVRVRRLGFTPAELLVQVRPGATDTVRIAMTRVVLNLSRVTVRSWPPCRNPGAPTPEADSTLFAVFEQLKFNAEQFRLLARSYPFMYTMERTMTNRMRETGRLALFWRGPQFIDSRTRWRYRPGEVIVHRGRASAFRIPTLAEIADDNFLRSHCFHYAGLDKVDSVDFVRVDLVAAEHIEKPDVNGSMYLDPQSLQIRRTVLYLSRRDKRLEYLFDMRVTTDFGEILPSIPVIVEVSSVQVMDPLVKSDLDEAYEEQRLIDFHFRGKKPGGP